MSMTVAAAELFTTISDGNPLKMNISRLWIEHVSNCIYCRMGFNYVVL